MVRYIIISCLLAVALVSGCAVSGKGDADVRITTPPAPWVDGGEKE